MIPLNLSTTFWGKNLVACDVAIVCIGSRTVTLQGTNISHLGKRKIIFKMPFLEDMLVPWRVYIITPPISKMIICPRASRPPKCAASLAPSLVKRLASHRKRRSAATAPATPTALPNPFGHTPAVWFDKRRTNGRGYPSQMSDRWFKHAFSGLCHR